MTWPDIWGSVISVMSVAVTVMTVIAAFHLSRNYVQSIREMEGIRKSSQGLERQVAHLAGVNSSLLRESMLAVKCLFDLVMLIERQSLYEKMLEDLIQKSEWRGEKVHDDRAEKYRENVRNEILSVGNAISTRKTELYWLIGRDGDLLAHLNMLTTTNGDAMTIDLFEAVRSVRFDAISKDDLLIGIAALKQRLGRPIFPGEPESWSV